MCILRKDSTSLCIGRLRPMMYRIADRDSKSKLIVGVIVVVDQVQFFFSVKMDDYWSIDGVLVVGPRAKTLIASRAHALHWYVYFTYYHLFVGLWLWYLLRLPSFKNKP